VLAFTSVYFSESGLFNGLRPIQIKKISPPVTLCLKRHNRVPPAPFAHGFDPANKSYSTGSDFRKDNFFVSASRMARLDSVAIVGARTGANAGRRGS
jgi:hypothetical protein